MAWKSCAESSKEIRAAYKALGWNRKAISVRSSNYSMGSSINIKILSPLVHAGEAERIAREIGESVSRCEMTGDILGGGNQFVFVEQSDECLRLKGLPYMEAVRAAFDACGDETGNGYPVEGVKGAFVMHNFPGETDLCIPSRDTGSPERYRFWSTETGAFERVCGLMAEYLKGEFKPNAPKPPTPGGGVRGDGYEVIESTKKRGPFSLVVMAERVERAQFEHLRDSAKAAGGWYSRAWGGKACGFGFADAASAKAWASGEFGEVLPDDGTPRENATANRLDKLADGLTADIESKRAPLTQNWTRRRGAQKDSQKQEADRLEKVQRGLRAMASALRVGNLPAELNSHLTKKAVYDLFSPWGSELVNEKRLLLELIEGNTTNADRDNEAQRVKAQEVEKLEEQARTWNFPGFFPTPQPVIDEMLTLSGVCVSGKRSMLEPSAGLGHIVFAALEANPDLVIDAVEVIPKACEIIRAKGFDSLNNADFLEAETGSTYDHILMNPPFERGADLKHVRRASELLGAGGRLVSVMTERGANAAVDEIGGWFEQLPSGSFNGAAAFRSTGVGTVLYILDN